MLFEGLELAAEAVMTTLGPKGKTVLIQKGDDSPIVTKDGVTVSKSIKLKHPIKKMGADLIREAASHTNEIAGDGTTTATVLTHAMVKEGLKLLEAGYSSRELCAGLEKARAEIDNRLLSRSKKLTSYAEIAQVATISANGDSQVGKLISTAMEKVGRDGIITVEDAKGMQTTLDIVEGMQFDRGYLSPYFVNVNEKMCASYVEARILLTDKKIVALKELVPLLEKVMHARQPLLIIADDIEGDALQGLVVNRVNGNLPVVAVKAPGYGKHRHDLLNDISILTGAKLISNSMADKLETVSLGDLGTLKKMIVDSKSTTLVATGSNSLKLEEHLQNLRTQLDDVTLNSEDVIRIKSRMAKLSSGVAVIKVGGATEVEMVELKYRIEDALNATRAAAAEGIVAGGGMTLATIAEEMMAEKNELNLSQDELAGFSIAIKACQAPMRRIVENAGTSPDLILRELKHNPGLGYNAANGQFVDMMEEGVIDPVKVTRTALKNASSVATTFMSLDAVIFEEEQEN